MATVITARATIVVNDPADRAGIDLRDESGSPVDAADVRELAAFLLDELRMGVDTDLSITLVDEETMTQLHVEWMGEPGPTDVLSFPMDELREPGPGSDPPNGVLGDVVLCPAVAGRQAVAAGHSAQHELRILLTHGVLHLLGHDHADPDQERVMLSRQRELVERYEDLEGV